MRYPTKVEASFVLPFASNLIMKFLLVFTFAALGLWVMQAQAESGVHQGQYQKNLKYKYRQHDRVLWLEGDERFFQEIYLLTT